MARLDISSAEAEMQAFMNEDLFHRASPQAQKKFREITEGELWDSSRDAAVFSQHGGLTKDGYIIIEISKEQGQILYHTSLDEACEGLKHEKIGTKNSVKSIKGKIIFIWSQ
jgi:hypothetical protein